MSAAVFCIPFDTAQLPECVRFDGVMASHDGSRAVAQFTDEAPASPGRGGTFSVPVRDLSPTCIFHALARHRGKFAQGSAGVPPACQSGGAK
jgi:hypothetical protein